MVIPVGTPFAGGNGAAWTEIAPTAKKLAQIAITLRIVFSLQFSIVITNIGRKSYYKYKAIRSFRVRTFTVKSTAVDPKRSSDG
jgi:hypothetical protein